jgi:transmembrane sensor
MTDNTDPMLHSRETSLRAEALLLCRQRHEAPRDAALAARIVEWRERSSAHEACWQQAQLQWRLSGALRKPDASVIERLWYALDLTLERARAQPALVAVPALCLVMVLLLPVFRGPAVVVPAAAPVERVAAAVTQEYSSPARERRVVTLADGSILTLNWNSALAVTMGATSRDIVLQRGEVLFQVAPDENRPFTVNAGAIRARAVGTAFNVRRAAGDAVNVTVTEGIVEVSAAALASVRLGINEEISATPGHMGEVRTANAASSTAWTEGMLIFRERPLREVLAELGRYTHFPLRQGAIRNAGSPVTATYFIERSDDALSLIATAFDLQVRPNPDGSLQIESPRPQRPF